MKIGKFTNITRGFTLVEMLIVIVIIGILAGAIFPKIVGVIDRARDTAIKTDLKNIATALELYKMDYWTYKIEWAGWRWTWNGFVIIENWAADSYPKSIINALVEWWYFSQKIKSSSSKDYMIYLCKDWDSYALSAKLYYPTSWDIANIKTSCNGIGNNWTYTKYGMNYAVVWGR